MEKNICVYAVGYKGGLLFFGSGGYFHSQRGAASIILVYAQSRVKNFCFLAVLFRFVI
jgi:hypothetical protein